MEVGESRNWADLPPELTSAILVRLSLIDKLENAQKVCKSWYHVCKDPSMWRKIDMRYSNNMRYGLASMCRHAVDRSQGCLTEINIWSFGSDNLLNYIADRSSYLRCLRVQKSFTLSDNGLVRAVTKLPFLEELEISYCGKLDLKAIGHSCPLLKTFKLNYSAFSFSVGYNDDNDEALAIAETMSELRHLELSSNTITNSGLNAILDKCLHLEHLVLCRCFNINLVGDLKKRCSERIRYLICRGVFEGGTTAMQRAWLGEGFASNAVVREGLMHSLAHLHTHPSLLIETQSLNWSYKKEGCERQTSPRDTICLRSSEIL